MRRSSCSRSPEVRERNKEDQKDSQPKEKAQAREAPGAKELYKNIANITEKKKHRLDREFTLSLERSSAKTAWKGGPARQEGVNRIEDLILYSNKVTKVVREED